MEKEVFLYEELSMNAHPSIKTQLFDGWILRFANGYTNRANSINPLYPSEMAVEEKIISCEEIYKSQELDTVYKLTPLSINALDEKLAQKGYDKVTPTNIMTKSLISKDVLNTKAIVTEGIDSVWQDNYLRLNGIFDKTKIETAKIIQNNIQNKTICASITNNGMVIACGLCVIERDYAGLYDITVDKDYRGKGLGFDICNSLLNSAVKFGAKSAYLQVVADNNPAIALYEKLGFSNCYQYWYRVKSTKCSI